MVEAQFGLRYNMWSRLQWFLKKVDAFDKFVQTKKITGQNVTDRLRGTSVKKGKAVRAHVAGAGIETDKDYMWYVTRGDPDEVAKAINKAMAKSLKSCTYLATYIGPHEIQGQDAQVFHDACTAWNSKDEVVLKGRNLAKKKMKPMQLSEYRSSLEHVSYWCCEGFGGYKAFSKFADGMDHYEDAGFEGELQLFSQVYHLMSLERTDKEFLKMYQTKVWPAAMKSEFQGTNEQWAAGPILSKYKPKPAPTKKKKKDTGTETSSKKKSSKVKTAIV